MSRSAARYSKSAFATHWTTGSRNTASGCFIDHATVLVGWVGDAAETSFDSSNHSVPMMDTSKGKPRPRRDLRSLTCSSTVLTGAGKPPEDQCRYRGSSCPLPPSQKRMILSGVGDAQEALDDLPDQTLVDSHHEHHNLRRIAPLSGPIPPA